MCDLAAFALLDVDRDVRVLAKEGGERLRQIFRDTRCIGEEADGRLHPLRKFGEIATQRLYIMDDDPGMIEQAFTGRGQLDAAAAAREQRNPKRRLQPLDPLACRGQRQMHALGAIGDAAGLGDRDEKLKVDQIETHGDIPHSVFERRGHPVRAEKTRKMKASLRHGQRLSP